MRIRRFQEEDAEAVAALIGETMRTTNSRDYPPDYIEDALRHLQPGDIRERAGWTHFYVVCGDGEEIVGCGAIGPYWGKEDESSLFTIFVSPACQGRGIGRSMIQALEQDEYFLRARRVEIPASITGTPFYRKMGYDYKGNTAQFAAKALSAVLFASFPS